MDSRRREILIQEIEYWRKNRLLPEHYCLFLLNLYTEGQNAESGFAKKWGVHISRKTLIFSSIGIVLAIFCIYIGIYFASFSLWLQIAIFAILLISLYLFAAWIKKTSTILQNLALGIASALLLLFTLWELHQHDLMEYVFHGLMGSLTVWLLSGILFRSYYLSGIGIVGMILSIAWVQNLIP